jgi:hypothetical protein
MWVSTNAVFVVEIFPPIFPHLANTLLKGTMLRDGG